MEMSTRKDLWVQRELALHQRLGSGMASEITDIWSPLCRMITAVQCTGTGSWVTKGNAVPPDLMPLLAHAILSLEENYLAIDPPTFV